MTDATCDRVIAAVEHWAASLPAIAAPEPAPLVAQVAAA